ncbi:hypothetical protein MTO96_013539 [Rhipicephalus appendiculatus]
MFTGALTVGANVTWSAVRFCVLPYVHFRNSSENVAPRSVQRRRGGVTPKHAQRPVHASPDSHQHTRLPEVNEQPFQLLHSSLLGRG